MSQAVSPKMSQSSPDKASQYETICYVYPNGDAIMANVLKNAIPSPSESWSNPPLNIAVSNTLPKDGPGVPAGNAPQGNSHDASSPSSNSAPPSPPSTSSNPPVGVPTVLPARASMSSSSAALNIVEEAPSLNQLTTESNQEPVTHQFKETLQKLFHWSERDTLILPAD